MACAAAMAFPGAVCLADQPAPAQPPAPAERIEVASLGYLPPSSFYLTYRLSSMSMGFFDNDHLLFTFRLGGLLRRLPSDRPDDEDQEIRAVVLDLQSGKVVKQTEWRMHDRSRYLWAYPDGKFLVRIRNSLYLTDQSLELMPYLNFHSELRLLEVSPDRQTTLIETDKPFTTPEEIEGDEGPERSEPVTIRMFSSGSQAGTILSDARNPIPIPLVSNGIVDFIDGKRPGTWAMRDVLFHGEPKIVADVKSSCRPTLQPASETAVLVMGCYNDGGDDRPIYAISLDGSLLWQQRWKNKYVWGAFDYAENGTRFSWESVAVNRPVGAFDSLDPEDVTAQLAGVYDTQTGNLVLVEDASPVLTAAQNAVLSPDGSRFAILRKGAIEIYNLPPVADKPVTPPVKAKKK